MSYRSVFKPGLFEGQTVIVTGGGSGIGRCTAHEIAALGAHVVITGRKPDKLATVKDEIEASGGSCETHAFDIREEAQVKEAIAKMVAKNGRIHGLFNNAGGQFPSPAATLSAKGFDVVVRNNLTGGFIVSREVFTQSMEKHGGSIVNMAADMRNGFPNMAHTGAARAGGGDGAAGVALCGLFGAPLCGDNDNGALGLAAGAARGVAAGRVGAGSSAGCSDLIVTVRIFFGSPPAVVAAAADVSGCTPGRAGPPPGMPVMAAAEFWPRARGAARAGSGRLSGCSSRETMRSFWLRSPARS